MTPLEAGQNALDKIYIDAMAFYESNESKVGISREEECHLKTILANQEKRKAAVAVLVTLMLKKMLSPSQDIRLHRAEFDGGFSGRRLDTDVVTPFLRSQNFPNMSESGWLTRSFEQSHPYDFQYPGNITPKTLKNAFLHLIDSAQENGADKAKSLLCGLFLGLIEARDKNTNLKLARPVNLSVAEVVDKLRQHLQAKSEGVARLPVLAIHAILTVLARETDRYRTCNLLPLEAHTTADSRSQRIGDVNILDANGALFEGYEIKHNVPITSELIAVSFQKLRNTPVQRFYILTTFPQGDYDEFRGDIQRVARTRGCQLIVNGVDRTLLYYLRLIGSTRTFIDAYVSHLELDANVNFHLKERWNQIISKN